MKVLGAVLLAVGAAVLTVGIIIARTSGLSDPGQLRAPTVLGIGILIAAAGGTLVASVLVLGGWFAPVLGALSRVRSQSPEGLTRVVQRTKTLKAGLERATGHYVDLGKYLVFGKTDNGIGFWNADAKLLADIPSDDVISIEVGEAFTTRTVPSLRITVQPAGSAQSIVLEVIPSRDGFELFPVLDPTAVGIYVGQMRAAVARP